MGNLRGLAEAWDPRRRYRGFGPNIQIPAIPPPVFALCLLVAVLALDAAAQAPTSIALTVTPGSSTAGQPVALTAAISPAASGGKVSFYDGTSILGTTAVAAGSATFTSSQLLSGTHAFEARLVATATFQAIASNVVPYSVAPKRSYGFLNDPGSPFSADRFPIAVVVGDFNGDGKLDLAIANNASNDVSVLLGDGNGGFTPAGQSPYPVNGSPLSIVVGDFNEDGHADLAVVTAGNSVTVLLGDGTGAFAPAAGIPVALGPNGIPYSVAVGDFNEDGHADLAVAKFGTNDVTVLLGDGTGGFTPAQGSPFRAGTSTSQLGQNSSFIAVGDFNEDGHADLAVGNSGTNDVTVLLGDGAGGFAPAQGSPFNVGSDNHTPTCIAVGDFNGDGHADLAIGAEGVTLLLGNGHGGFAPAPNSPFATGTEGIPYSLAAADIDGDGNPDVVVATVGRTDAAVLLGDGHGGLAPAAWSPLPVGLETYSVALGDFNGDGRPDLAFANHTGVPNITVLLAAPGLIVTESRQGPSPFGQLVVGQSGVVSLSVQNVVSTPITGEVKVVDNLPAGLAPTALAATGWSCTVAGQSVTCARSDGLSGGATFPPINLEVNVTGRACQFVSDAVLSVINTVEVQLNGVVVDTSAQNPTSSIVECFGFILQETAQPVVNQMETYVLTVQAAEGASIPLGFPLQVTLLASALISPSATGDGWSCLVSGALVNCTTPGNSPLNSAGNYPQILVTGILSAAACPTSTVQLTILNSGTLQNDLLGTVDLFGCLTFIPFPPVFNFGLVPYQQSFVVASLVVASNDTHPVSVSVSPAGYPEFVPVGAPACDQAGPLSFQQSCTVYAALFPCTGSPNGVLTILATVPASAGGGRAQYPIPVQGSAVLSSVAINVQGVTGQAAQPATGYAVQPATQYPASTTLTPAPSAACPQNVPPMLTLSFSPLSPTGTYYDEAFDPATSMLQTGTVAGAITLTAQSNGQAITPLNGPASITLTVPPQAPVVESVTLQNQTDSSFQVTVDGYSTPREADANSKTQVCLQFLSASGAKVQPDTTFCALQDEIRIWYQQTVSYPYGSQFQGKITVSFTGDKSAIGGVMVVIQNIVGNSAPYCVDFKSGNKMNCPQ